MDISDLDVAREVLELQRVAYRVEADLIGSDEIPALRETLTELQNCGETFLGIRIGGLLAGAVSWRFDGETVDLHRLVVSPSYFRKGLGLTLVRSAVSAEPTARRAIVQTGAANRPATALYSREGFVAVGELEPVVGLRVACFSKQLR